MVYIIIIEGLIYNHLWFTQLSFVIYTIII